MASEEGRSADNEEARQNSAMTGEKPTDGVESDRFIVFRQTAQDGSPRPHVANCELQCLDHNLVVGRARAHVRPAACRCLWVPGQCGTQLFERIAAELVQSFPSATGVLGW